MSQLIRGLASRAAFLSLSALLVAIGFFLDDPILRAQNYQHEELKESAEAASISVSPKPQKSDKSASVIEIATKLAKRSQFADGINLLKLIQPGDLGYQTAQSLKTEWVGEILQRGRSKIQQGYVKQGLAILRSVSSEDLPAEAGGVTKPQAAGSQHSTR